ncbi:hypothetical protein K435DRAFT_959258 [Dendrothele bispora CBS 962.96]|uniref:Uncharacterized protein n=1 Tax=Dendrothele bispora (strain CBS 962.96) TaxID=1314807 RepID=A0A4S8MXB9_DENBC|nr:hypothetical protein K435DRAFT_959258 [Dendrothele bispora CBS 962.96]
MSSRLEEYSDIATPIFFGFVGYYLVERLLKYLVGGYLHGPPFKAALRSSHKEPVYYGILLGAFIAFFSTPFCAAALWRSNPFSLSPGPTFSTSAEICITSRAVLFISELNRLDLYASYVYHHLGCVVVIASAFQLGVPELLYLPFTTLVSEIPGDLTWIITAHRDLNDSSTFAAWGEKWRSTIKNVNFWVYTICRVPSVPAMAYTVSIAIRRHRMELWQAYGFIIWVAVILCAYSFWIWRYLKSQRGTSMTVPDKVTKEQSVIDKTWSFSFDHPIHVRLPSNYILTLYGPLMGLALSSLALVSFILSQSPRDSLAIALSVTIISAVLFARLLCLVYEDTLSVFFQNPLRVFLRPGFWLHGGVFGAALGLMISSYVLNLIDMFEVASAFCIAFPLYESISRLGCHTYGCCYGRKVEEAEISSSQLLKLFSPVTYVTSTAAAVRLNPALHGKPLYPIQKISSFLFFVQFIVIAFLTVKMRVDIGLAGSVSLATHAVIRLWTENFRDDFRGEVWGVIPLTATGRISLVQCMVGAGMSLTWRAGSPSVHLYTISEVLHNTDRCIWVAPGGHWEGNRELRLLYFKELT